MSTKVVRIYEDTYDQIASLGTCKDRPATILKSIVNEYMQRQNQKFSLRSEK